MYTPTTKQILDHGYVRFIEAWGSDERIIEAARMSTAKGFQGWGPKVVRTYQNEAGVSVTETAPGDEKLLAYLWNNKHATPFEMAGMIIEVQAPIFVFREWHRHRTQSYNEMSARYTPLPDVNYLPSAERCLVVSSTNKQAGAVTDGLTHEKALGWLEELSDLYVHAQRVYQHGLEIGVPKEVARLPLPVGRYSRMRASANLRNWLAFLTLRMDSSAQWEIQQFANAVGELIEQRFPRTWGLFSLPSAKI